MKNKKSKAKSDPKGFVRHESGDFDEYEPDDYISSQQEMGVSKERALKLAKFKKWLEN